MSEGLLIDILQRDDSYVIRLEGELDILAAPLTVQTISRVAGAAVVVDLSGVSFIDSSGVAALDLARRQIEAGGGTVAFRGATQIVRRVFAVLGMETWLAE